MRLLYCFAYLAGNGIFTLLTWKFYSAIFEKAKVRKDIELLCFSLYFTLTILLLYISSEELRLFGNLILLALPTLLYQAHWTKKLFCALSLFLFSAFSHYGLVFLSGEGHFLLYHPDRFRAVIGVALECLFVYLFIRLLTFAAKHLQSNANAVMDWAVAFVVPLCAAFLLCIALIRTDSGFNSLFFISILLLVTVNLLALFTYWFRTLKARMELISYQNKYYQNQLEIIEASESSVKSLRHDLENHLLTLSHLLQEENLPQARKYLTAAHAQLDAARVLSRTGNSCIDSLINYKLHHLEDAGVHLDYQAEIPSQLQIDAFDLTVILGNLLDNALEALDRLPASEEKDLSLHLKYDRGRLLIKISNTCDEVKHSSRGLLTRKTHPAIHGIGLKNVRAAIDKYQGHLKTTFSQNRFTAYAIIYEPAGQG